MNFHKIQILISLMISASFLSCQQANKTKVLKLAHNLNTSHPVHKALGFMSGRVKELSNGKLDVYIYPGGQLGSEQQNVELLQLGSLAMTKVSAAVMEGFSKDYQVLGLPYIFTSRSHYFEVCDGTIGKDILTSTDNKKLRGLAFYNAGSRSFYSTEKAIHTPKDLEGSKIRVMNSQTAIQMVNGLGGSATPLAWGELYTALQSGVVDGAENNPPTFYLSHHYEVCKFFTLDEHTSIPDVLLMSKIIWDKLSAQEQVWLTQAANESVNVQRKLWADAEEKAIEKLKEADVEIIYPDKSLFSNELSSFYEGYKEDTKLYTYIQRIKALNDEENN